MKPRALRIAGVLLTLVGLGVGAKGLVQAQYGETSGVAADAVEVENTWHALPGPERFAMDPTTSQETVFPGERSRRLLALYDSSETIEEEDDHEHVTLRPIDSEVALVHRFAELPLNHLGLIVDYRDVNGGGLPGPDEMEKYLGVISWFSDSKMKSPETYLRWVIEQTEAGRRVVVMEYLGAFTNLDNVPTDPELIKASFRALGGEYQASWTDDSSIIAVAESDPEVMGFEQALPDLFGQYELYKANSDAKVYLRLERTDQAESASDVAWTSPTGGFVMVSISHSESRLGERFVVRWLINPFRFFEDAFGTAGWPRPDFTTLNGRRIFYMHIDGDGLDTITELDYKTRCGEVIRRDVLTKYDLPVTASAVIGLTAPPPYGKGTLTDTNVARAIFRLDNVEIASHGYAHPMDWRAGDKSELSVTGLPDYELSGKSEVADTVAYINEHLAPPGKPCRMMLWTGWCNPNEQQLEASYGAGVRNLNGGDPRMDSHYPSYTHMVPPVHQVGSQLQYFTSAANDYILTDDWTPPYYRFQNVVQTFEQTGSPRRIVPVNIYIHYYIARNFSGLAGLHHTLEWVLSQPLAPVFASQYVDIARDFHWARIAQRDERSWVVHKGPALRTIRFDNAEQHIDLASSQGVIGYVQNKELGVTYVHLSDAPEVTIVTADGPPATPFLWQATHPVEDSSFGDAQSLSFRTGGVGERSFELAGLKAGGSYQIKASAEDRAFAPITAIVDQSGILRFGVSGKTTRPIAVTAELMP